MRHNDNEFDQLFRDRLRDHASPVRADLWRRIHTGVGTPARRPHLLRHWRYLGAGATTVTVALAAHLIFTPTHHPHPPITPVNHYSNISRGATRRPDTLALNQTPILNQIPTLDQTITQPPTRTLIMANSPQLAPARQTTTLDPNRAAAANPIAKSNPALYTPDQTLNSPNQMLKTPGHPLNSPAHVHYAVTLPAIARTSTRTAIITRSLIVKSRHNDPGTSPDDAPRHIKTGYISFYGSVDFPANHYYTWSYTAGGAVTIQFSRHWSGTAGFEYGRVNVPTQVVPPVNLFDTLHAFHFSNDEIPVLIGYTMMLGSYALTVNGGAILNLYSRQSNSRENPALSSTSTWVFNWPNRDAYGAYLGADIFRPIGHSLRVFAQPYARFSISNYRMFIPEQRFFYGAHLGIRYQL